MVKRYHPIWGYPIISQGIEIDKRSLQDKLWSEEQKTWFIIIKWAISRRSISAYGLL